MKCLVIVLLILCLSQISNTLKLTMKNQELFIKCLKLKEEMKNSEINCEKILMKEFNEQKSQIENIPKEKEENNSAEVMKEFDYITQEIENQMNGMKNLQKSLLNFKNKILKKNNPTPTKKEEQRFKSIPDKMSDDNLSEEETLSILQKKYNALNAKKIEESKPIIQQPKSLDFQNLDIESIQKLLAIKQNESQPKQIQIEDNNNNENTENLFKDFLMKNKNKDNNINKEEQKEKPAAENKSIGLSLSEIEKQIAMLKNLSIKS